jgi:hypothetical protein
MINYLQTVSDSIGGAVGKDNICQMLQDHFMKLLNSSTDDSNKCHVLNYLNSMVHGSHINHFTVNEVKK